MKPYPKHISDQIDFCITIEDIQKDFYPLVYIKWVDSQSSSGWTEIDNIKLEIVHIKTVGFLIKENDDCILVASSADLEKFQTHSYLVIPKVAIVDRINLTL